MTQKRTFALLAVVVALGLAVRLFHFWSIAETAFPRIPLVHTQSDMHSFWQWAQTIVAGDWLGRDTYHPYFEWMSKMGSLEDWRSLWGAKEVYHQAPLYAYFLGAVFSFHNAPAFALLVQLVLGALQPLILFFLGRRLFDARVALVAATLTALYGPFIFYQATLLRDWLPPIVEPLILLLVLRADQRQRTIDWLAAGMVIGVGILVKETTGAVSTIALGWLIVRHFRAWRALRRPLALLAAGVLICLAPLFARNVAVGAPPFAISGQGPGNILIGFVADMPPSGFTSPSKRAQQIATLSDGTVWSAALETLRGHSLGELLSHEWLKLRAIIDPFEVWNNTSYYYGVEISPVLQITPGYGVIFPLGVAGALLLLPAWRRFGLFYAYLLASLAVQMVTIVLARFRLALIPVLILGAAFLLVQLFAAIRNSQDGRAVIVVAVVLTISLVQQLLPPLTPVGTPARPTEYLLAVKVYDEEKRYDLAVRELARLREHAIPTVDEGHARVRLAAILLRDGYREAAREQVQLAENVYASVRDDSGLSLYLRGLIYEMLGDRDKARTFFNDYLVGYPHGPKVHEILSVLSSMGDER